MPNKIVLINSYYNFSYKSVFNLSRFCHIGLCKLMLYYNCYIGLWILTVYVSSFFTLKYTAV